MSKELDDELNDPGNEDPGSLMDDAEVPLNDLDEAADVGNTENLDGVLTWRLRRRVGSVASSGIHAHAVRGTSQRSSNKRSKVSTGNGRLNR
ncbi:hypothetical protein [Pseudomonas sp. EA_35y_Pfl1_P108]|uniref:hypothetical protein n=1 Tax=Pseudomonas sp. EA_35y_Pfl1_P108 TaxID=3088688 RepID=UPI0030DD9F67